MSAATTPAVDPLEVAVAKLREKASAEWSTALREYRSLVNKLSVEKALTAAETNALAGHLAVLGLDPAAVQTDVTASRSFVAATSRIIDAEEMFRAHEQKYQNVGDRVTALRAELRELEASAYRHTALAAAVAGAARAVADLKAAHPRVFAETYDRPTAAAGFMAVPMG